MRVGVVAAVVGCAGFVVMAEARAQSAAVGPPVVAPLVPGASQDASLRPDARDAFALEPLRLDLLSSFVPHRLNEPGCSDHVEAAGTATGGPGFPLMTAAAIGIPLFGRRSSWKTPRLTLFGMSRGGCAIDAAAGGGATITIPITRTTFFAWGGGAIYLPRAGPGGAPIQHRTVRADLVFQQPSGRSYTVGIGVQEGVPRISVGGIF
ncbi:MAG: hypothetical protein KIT84_29840 [Labilithrix sp.]|nr:hypothetical protein [Labilithrix sp.]MCW5815266.1 hypothetical protein [Labilithrix sp.]